MPQWCLYLVCIFTEWYSDVLSMLASHGLIVVGVDLFWPAVSSNPTTGNSTTTSATDTSIDNEPEFMYKVIQWVSQMIHSTCENQHLILVFIHELT